jgi:hypothetical protein
MKRAKIIESDREAVLDIAFRPVNLSGGVRIENFSGPFGTKVTYLARVATLTLAVTWVRRITVST